MKVGFEVTQGGHLGGHLQQTRDTMSRLCKSGSPLIPVGTSVSQPEADVPVLCKGKEINVPSHCKSPADHADQDASKPQYLIDCDELSLMGLRLKYKFEANSHHAMLDRAKQGTAKVPRADWKGRGGFCNYLRDVGLKGSRKMTADRLSPTDPEYAPGKIRWADKTTQSNNRSISILFHSDDGQSYTASELAKRQGVSASAIRKRAKRDGWTNAEIIAGRRFDRGPEAPVSPGLTSPTSAGRTLVDTWMEAAHERDPDSIHAWLPRERGQFDTIFVKYLSQLQLDLSAHHIIHHTIENWASFTGEAKRRAGLYNIPSDPDVTFFCRHLRDAVNLWQQEQTEKFREEERKAEAAEKEAVAQAKVQVETSAPAVCNRLHITTPKPFPQPKDPIMTPDEIRAWIAANK